MLCAIDFFLYNHIPSVWYHCPKHCRNLISKLPDENCFVETIACPRHMLFMCVCVCPRRFFRFMVSMPVIKPCLILPNPLFQVHVARCQESRYQCVYVVSVKMLYIYICYPRAQHICSCTYGWTYIHIYSYRFLLRIPIFQACALQRGCRDIFARDMVKT